MVTGILSYKKNFYKQLFSAQNGQSIHGEDPWGPALSRNSSSSLRLLLEGVQGDYDL